MANRHFILFLHFHFGNSVVFGLLKFWLFSWNDGIAISGDMEHGSRRGFRGRIQEFRFENIFQVSDAS